MSQRGMDDDELAKFADGVYEMYKNYRIAGFDNSQAFRLVSDFAAAMMAASLKTATGDK
jgi:hypothetical protein